METREAAYWAASFLLSELDLELDALVVGAPVGDGLLDGLGFEALGECGVGEGGEFGVGGEAEGDELVSGEVVNVSAVLGWQEHCET